MAEPFCGGAVELACAAVPEPAGGAVLSIPSICLSLAVLGCAEVSGTLASDGCVPEPGCPVVFAAPFAVAAFFAVALEVVFELPAGEVDFPEPACAAVVDGVVSFDEAAFLVFALTPVLEPGFEPCGGSLPDTLSSRTSSSRSVVGGVV